MKHRKRLFISKKMGAGERNKTIRLALENECNTLVFSLDDPFFKNPDRKLKYINLIKRYSLEIEAGGSDLSLLLPKRLFRSNRELFRMEHGKRKNDHHFCPTNPKTTAIISQRAYNLFGAILHIVSKPRIFHILPDKDFEKIWCACPACRAFSPKEQYLIAANTAANALAKLDAKAQLTYLGFDANSEAKGILPRANMKAC